MATLVLGVGILEFTSDTDTATTPRKFRFCDGRNLFTIVPADLATEETACAVILAEESALLAATPKDTRAATPISVIDFT